MFLGDFETLRKALISFVMFVRPSGRPLSVWNNSASTGRIFMKFLFIFPNFVEKIQD